MSKKFNANGRDIWVNEEDFNDVCELFKENVQIDSLKKWETKVKFFSILYFL